MPRQGRWRVHHDAKNRQTKTKWLLEHPIKNAEEIELVKINLKTTSLKIAVSCVPAMPKIGRQNFGNDSRLKMTAFLEECRHLSLGQYHRELWV